MQRTAQQQFLDWLATALMAAVMVVGAAAALVFLGVIIMALWALGGAL